MRETLALDGMRGLAALLVVGFHVVVFASALDPSGVDLGPWDHPISAAFLDWGFIGVDFFFVLSAFLLSQPFLATGLKHDLRSYVAKRMLRVVPAYYAALLLGYLLLGHTDHPWFAMDWKQVWRHALFLHGFWLDSQLAVNPVFWTLGVELQFYMLLPLLALAFRGRWWPVALATCLAITLVYRAWALVPGDGVTTLFREQQLPGFLWHFGLGITMARFRRQVRQAGLQGWWLDLAILTAIAGLIVVPSAWFGHDRALLGAATLPWILGYRTTVAVGFAAVIVLGCAGAGALNRAFESAPLRRLGAWSYSLYLTHFPVSGFVLLTWPALFSLALPVLYLALAVVSIAVAAVFHLAVERPALRAKDSIANGMATRRGRPEPDA